MIFKTILIFIVAQLLAFCTKPGENGGGKNRGTVQVQSTANSANIKDRTIKLDIPLIPGKFSNFQDLDSLEMTYFGMVETHRSVNDQSSQKVDVPLFAKIINIEDDGAFRFPAFNLTLPFNCIKKTCRIRTSFTISFAKKNLDGGFVIRDELLRFSNSRTLNRQIEKYIATHLSPFHVTLSVSDEGIPQYTK